MTQERKTLGSVYRVTAEFLAERGLMPQVLPRASAEARRILEKLPFPFGWQSAGPLEEIERIVFDLPQGADLCADLGTAASLKLCGSVIQGVLRMAFSLFGQTPASLFAHADRFFAIVSSGFAFRYQPSADKAGVVVAEVQGGDAHPSLFHQIRGNLRGGFALCGVNGEIDAPRVERQDAQGASVRYAVRWD